MKTMRLKKSQLTHHHIRDQVSTNTKPTDSNFIINSQREPNSGQSKLTTASCGLARE